MFPEIEVEGLPGEPLHDERLDINGKVVAPLRAWLELQRQRAQTAREFVEGVGNCQRVGATANALTSRHRCFRHRSDRRCGGEIADGHGRLGATRSGIRGVQAGKDHYVGQFGMYWKPIVEMETCLAPRAA